MRELSNTELQEIILSEPWGSKRCGEARAELNRRRVSYDRHQGAMHLGIVHSEAEALALAEDNFTADEWKNVRVEMQQTEIDCGWYATREEFEKAYAAEVAAGYMTPHYVNGHWVGIVEFWAVIAEERGAQ